MAFENIDHIKLVVVDMDGTLLNNKKEMPPETLGIVNTLYENGVKFMVATGRQYWNVRDLFLPVINRMGVLADNGACCFDEDEPTSSQLLPRECLPDLLASCRTIKHSWPIVCGIDKAYIEAPNVELLTHTVAYYRRFELIDNLEDVLDREVIKFAVYDGISAEENAYPILKSFEDRMQVKVSGFEWVDINATGCNKGRGLRVVQDQLGISPDETMVFGDYLNDLEMMKEAKFSYAMENAHPQIKKAANFIAPSNEEAGVIQVIKSCFHLNS